MWVKLWCYSLLLATGGAFCLTSRGKPYDIQIWSIFFTILVFWSGFCKLLQNNCHLLFFFVLCNFFPHFQTKLQSTSSQAFHIELITLHKHISSVNFCWKSWQQMSWALQLWWNTKSCYRYYQLCDNTHPTFCIL